MKTILLTFALGLSLNTADACPMADAAAFQEAAEKVAATEGAHASFIINGMLGSSPARASTKIWYSDSESFIEVGSIKIVFHRINSNNEQFAKSLLNHAGNQKITFFQRGRFDFFLLGP